MKTMELWDWVLQNQRLKSKNKLTTEIKKIRWRLISWSVEKNWKYWPKIG